MKGRKIHKTGKRENLKRCQEPNYEGSFISKRSTTG
jgi:hypothetical protein